VAGNGWVRSSKDKVPQSKDLNRVARHEDLCQHWAESWAWLEWKMVNVSEPLQAS